MAHDVFISYSHHDKQVADAVCARLEHNGIRCWIGPRDVLAGQNYGSSIIAGINGCRVMVVIFSAASDKSRHVNNEVERAFNKGVAILPFRIEDRKPSESMELFLSSSHWLDALTPPIDAHIGLLINSINAILGKSPTRDEVAAQTPTLEPKSQIGMFTRIEKSIEKISIALQRMVTSLLALWALLAKQFPKLSREGIEMASAIIRTRWRWRILGCFAIVCLLLQVALLQRQHNLAVRADRNDADQKLRKAGMYSKEISEYAWHPASGQTAKAYAYFPEQSTLEFHDDESVNSYKYVGWQSAEFDGYDAMRINLVYPLEYFSDRRHFLYTMTRSRSGDPPMMRLTMVNDPTHATDFYLSPRITEWRRPLAIPAWSQVYGRGFLLWTPPCALIALAWTSWFTRRTKVLFVLFTFQYLLVATVPSVLFKDYFEGIIVIAIAVSAVCVLQFLFLLPIIRPREKGGKGADWRIWVGSGLGGLFAGLFIFCALGLIQQLLWSVDVIPDRAADGKVWILVFSVAMFMTLLISWIFFTIFIVSFMKKGNREGQLCKVAASLFLGSIVETLAAIPIAFLVNRKTSCVSETFTGASLFLTISIGTLLFGPVILLVVLARRSRARDRGICAACGTKIEKAHLNGPCPSCGVGWRELKGREIKGHFSSP